MAVTPYNDDLSGALKYCRPQVAATLSASTKPTLADATAIWEEQWGALALELQMAGIDPAASSFTAESSALLWVQKVESYLTSGNVLLELGSQGKRPEGQRGVPGGDSTAVRLLKKATEEIAKLHGDRRFRLSLIASGATAKGLGTSGFASSDFTDGRDTRIDITFGGPNVDYIPSVPAIQDGESL